MTRAFMMMSFLLVLSGCKQEQEYTKAYRDFIEQHGTDSRYYCDDQTGFFMNESISPIDEFTMVIYIQDKNGNPVECNYDIIEQLKEVEA